MDAVAGTAAVREPRGRTLPRLEALGQAILVVLLLEVAVGIANTLWLDIPDTGNAWLVPSPILLLTAHLVLALFITILSIWLLSIWLLVGALKVRSRMWLPASIVGFLGVLAVLASGAASMSLKDTTAPSFVMATGCLVSIGSYAIALSKGRGPAPP